MTPSRRSIKARFWPYCPNNAEARRLSSKVRAICVALSCATMSDSSVPGVRNSGSCAEASRLLRGLLWRLLRKHAEQTIAGDFGDCDGGNLADQRRRRLGLHRLQIGRTTDKLTGVAAAAFEKHIQCAADAAAIERRLILVDRVLQPRQAIRLRFFRHLIVHRGAGSAGPRRVLKENAPA